MLVKNKNSNNRTKNTSGFTTLGNILLVCFVVSVIVLFVNGVSPILILISALPDIFLICITYAVGRAKERIDKLETILIEKNLIDKKDLEIEE